jgi:hypothetical protein
VTPENPLAEGEHEAVVVITDPAGNASEPSDPIGFIVDTTPPAKPTIDTVFDDVGGKTGNLTKVRSRMTAPRPLAGPLKRTVWCTSW